MDDAGFALLGHCQPAAPEHRQHRLIVRQHLGLEVRQALIAGNLNEVPEDHAGDPTSVVRVGGDKGQFRTAGRVQRLLGTVAAARPAALRRRRRLTTTSATTCSKSTSVNCRSSASVSCFL